MTPHPVRRLAAVALAVCLSACGPAATPGGPRRSVEEVAGQGAAWARVPDVPLSPRTDPVVAWTGSEVLVVGGNTGWICPPYADCHSSCERMATAGGWGGGVPGGSGVDVPPTTSVSPFAKSRPCAGGTPSAGSRSSVTDADRTRRGRSAAIRFTSPVVNAPTAANDWVSSRNSKNSGGETQNWSNPMLGNRVVR